MHPYILSELARIRTDALIDEARRAELAKSVRRQQAAARRTKASARTHVCTACGRSPCSCVAA